MVKDGKMYFKKSFVVNYWTILAAFISSKFKKTKLHLLTIVNALD